MVNQAAQTHCRCQSPNITLQSAAALRLRPGVADLLLRADPFQLPFAKQLQLSQSFFSSAGDLILLSY
jgi:hypothetical protein